VEVLKGEQLPEDGQVGPKPVAADCDFNVILSRMIHQYNSMLKYNITIVTSNLISGQGCLSFK
jgi:hypothetical protein